MSTFYDKPLNASLHAPTLSVEVVDGIVTNEFVWQPLGNYHDNGSPWGYMGLAESELEGDGFKRRYPINDVITAAECAELYNVGHDTIRVSIHKGYIPARKSGGTWLLLRSDCEKRWGNK